MTSMNVNWMNNTDRGVVCSPGSDQLLRWNILPVMPTSETLFNTAPAQTHNAIKHKAMYLMIRRNNGCWCVSSPLFRRLVLVSCSVRDVWDDRPSSVATWVNSRSFSLMVTLCRVVRRLMISVIATFSSRFWGCHSKWIHGTPCS